MAKVFTKEILIYLVLIIFVGALLRFYKLDQLPLFGDEVDTGYNAYSILKSGKDVTDHFLPIYLRTFIDTKSSLLAYFSTVPIFFLGLNELSVRFVSALSGIGVVILVFLISKELFGKKLIALVAAFLVATSPWAIHLSRGVFEANLMLFLLLLGLCLFFQSEKNSRFLLASAFVFALSFYAYHAAKVLVPLLIVGIFFFSKEIIKKIPRRTLILAILVLLFVSAPNFYAWFFSAGQERFSEVNLLTEKKVVEEIILKREADVNPFIARFFHNKAEGYLGKFLANYWESFSPQFLFLYGDLNFRHSSGESGEFLPFCLPFFFLGLIFLAQKKKKDTWFLFYLLLIAPLPAAITSDGKQHAIRLLFMLPWVATIVAFGLGSFFSWIRKILGGRIALGAFLILGTIFLLNFSFYLHQYFAHYPKESWRYWAYGYKEAMNEIKRYEKDYDLVLINNSYEPSILWFLFWTEYEPNELLKADLKNHFQENIFPGANGFKLGKYFFVTPAKPGWKYSGVQEILKSNENVLFLASARDDTAGDKDLRDSPLPGTKLLKTIASPHNQPIFYLLTSDDNPVLR